MAFTTVPPLDDSKDTLTQTNGQPLETEIFVERFAPTKITFGINHLPARKFHLAEICFEATNGSAATEAFPCSAT